MRLWWIDKPECRNMIDIMNGIKAVYQMEQEFAPYLSVDFLPNKNHEPSGIILQAGNEIIRRNWSFDKKSEVDELRNLLWKYLLKYHNIREIGKDGCIKDFRKTMTFNVTQGFQNVVNDKRKAMCCRLFRDHIAKAYGKQAGKHEVFRLNSNNSLTRKSCKKVRMQECIDNYPPNSALFRRCAKEVNWLCNKGYSKQNPVNLKDKIVRDTREELYKILLQNDFLVDKRLFDQVITAGMFEDIANRMGNKSSNFVEIRDTVDGLLSEKNLYQKLTENVSDNYNSKEHFTQSSYLNYGSFFLLVIILIFIVVCILF